MEDIYFYYFLCGGILSRYQAVGWTEGLGLFLVAANIFLFYLFNTVWNKVELPDQWKESIIAPIHKKGDKTNFILVGCIPLLRN
jgi:hypothetical protein